MTCESTVNEFNHILTDGYSCNKRPEVFYRCFVTHSTSDGSYLVIGKCYSSTSYLKHSFAVPLDYSG